MTVDQHGPVARDGGSPHVPYQDLKLVFGVVPITQLSLGLGLLRLRARPLQYHYFGDRPLDHVRLTYDGVPRRHQGQQLVSVQLLKEMLRELTGRPCESYIWF